jgi:AcrR family transcriptional regulator
MRKSDTGRREAVVEAAERLFYRDGVSKTTIGDIAREAGIAVGSVYLEFRSKSDVVAEVVRRRHEAVLQAMRGAARDGSFSARLAHVLGARVEALLDQGDLPGATAAAAKSKTSWRFAKEEVALIASLLEQGSRAGEFAVHEVQPTVELIQRAYASLSPPALFDHERPAALRAVRAMSALLVNGLLARQGRATQPSVRPTPRRRTFGSR